MRRHRLIVLCASVLALIAVASASAAPGDPIDPRTYAPESTQFLELHAVGVQKYTCQPDGTWLFTDPAALLFKSFLPVGVHYLNFETGRPVWRLIDGSRVEAARKASAPNGAANIPLLLLQSVATTPGKLGHAAWVQRLNTAGGVAPAAPCTPGDTAAVPYTAAYVFWK
jgi:hypothetical protein